MATSINAQNGMSGPGNAYSSTESAWPDYLRTEHPFFEAAIPLSATIIMRQFAVLVQGERSSYNRHSLGISLEVGRLTLDYPETNKLLSDFLRSRRQGLSPRTIDFYKRMLTNARPAVGVHVTGQDIQCFLNDLQCANGGKHGYYRALRTFYRWLYLPRSGYRLNPQNNPILLVEAPTVEKKILPSLTPEQVDYLIGEVSNLRDRAIISLFAGSGMRLNELVHIRTQGIDWETYTVTTWGKGSKQRKAPFTDRSAKLLRALISQVEYLVKVPDNMQPFHDIMSGTVYGGQVTYLTLVVGWSDLSMVLRYARSITF